MLKSMTGYGKGETATPQGKFTVEIRSVNHRYGEISVRMPRAFFALENELKRTVSGVLKRGKIDVFVQWEEVTGADAAPQIDIILAKQFNTAFCALADELRLSRTIPLSLLLAQKGVIRDSSPIQDETELQPYLLSAVKSAVETADTMRCREGESLAADLVARRIQVSDWVDEIRQRTSQTVEEYRQKLKARLEQLLDGAVLDEWRLAQEIALIADRCDITEELVRLVSHFEQFDETLQLPEAVGRKLDFLMQEMNREINTIGSKSSDAGITALVVRIKAEMEKMREQVQNVE